jgi:aspartyl-tRNA(Asn)/glutamyl-tRNA(Gln) amidotransferase subunit C
MTIDIDAVKHIAKLARLQLSQDEEKLYAGQLNKIIGYFDELNAIDTTNVEPMSHALPVVNVMRDDELVPSPGHETLLAGAPAAERGFFKVPKI